MDTPTSYFGTEEFARFKQMNKDVFRVEAQAKVLGMEEVRLALYRARIELGHEESRYRAQYAKDAAASLVQGTEATAGGGATQGVTTPDEGQAAQYEAWDRHSALACTPEPGEDDHPADVEQRNG